MISVIIPWSDRPDLVEALRENLSWMTAPPVGEVIVVCCGGNLQELRSLLAPDFDFVKVEHVRSTVFNKGLALNMGAHRSKGDRLLFLDVDVILAPDWAAQAARLTEDEGLVFLGRVEESSDEPQDWDECFAPDGSRLAPGIVMLRRKDFLAVEGMNSALSGWGYEDIDLFHRMQAKQVPFSLLGWGVHLSHRDTTRQFADEKLQNQERNASDCQARYARKNYQGTLQEDITAHTWLEAFRPFGGQVAILEELAGNHYKQWQLEDESRSPKAGDQERARIKRDIDAYNSARHKAIAAFDATLVYRAGDVFATPVSETPGEIADRIFILDLKIDHAKISEIRLQLRAWRDHLITCLHLTLEGMVDGGVLLPPRTPVKLYRTEPQEADARIPVN